MAMPGSSCGRLMIAPPDLRDLAPRGGCESAATQTDGAHPVPERDAASLLVLSIRDQQGARAMHRLPLPRYCHTLVVVRFVWDKRKAATNLEKHGVSFEEASTAFEDELGAYYPDSLHEDRFILIGYSRKQRVLYVVHAEVEVQAIRIISARKATKHEKRRYEDD